MRFCTYILLVALTLQSFYRSIMAMDYELHLPEYLAKCINKDRPELHCKGQCELMKKVREKEKEESKKNLVIYEYSSLYVQQTFAGIDLYQAVEERNSSDFSPYLMAYRFDYNPSIFHPPLL